MSAIPLNASKAAVPLPPRELGAADLAAALVGAIEKLGQREQGVEIQQKKNNWVLSALAIVGLVAIMATTWTARGWADSRANEREQSTERHKEVMAAITTVRADQQRMQRAINHLYRQIMPGRARPKDLEPLTDAVTTPSEQP